MPLLAFWACPPLFAQFPLVPDSQPQEFLSEPFSSENLLPETFFPETSLPGTSLSALDTPPANASQDEQSPAGPLMIAPMIVGLPEVYPSTSDRLLIQPQVQLGPPTASSSYEQDLRYFQMQRPSAELSSLEQMFFVQEALPPPEILPDQSINFSAPGPQEVAPVFLDLLASAPVQLASRTSWRSLLCPQCPGDGLGQERLPFALFDIDPARPFNNFRVRTAIARRMQLPDRAEYFWQRTVDRRGPPAGESLIDYQQLMLRMELGSKQTSTAFEIPFRATNPEVNRNHAGLGDMQLIVKTVLVDGKQWLLTQYMGTYFSTGSPTMGLGTGHVGMEPGLLFRNRMNERTWMHGELKFWFPLGADPQHGGQVLKFATGFNRVWWESDTKALVPSLEFTNYTVLNGLARSASGMTRSVDGDAIFYITPGIHYALDNKGDFGLFEFGSSLSFATTTQRFAESTFTFDLRWSW